MLSFKKCQLKFRHYFRSFFRPSVQARARRARSGPPWSPSITSPWSCPLSAPRWAWSPGAGARPRSRTCSTGWSSAGRQVRRKPTAAGKWDKENERNVGMKCAYKTSTHYIIGNIIWMTVLGNLQGLMYTKEPCNYEHFWRDTKLWTPPGSKIANFFPYLRFPLADLPDATDPYKQARFSNLFMGEKIAFIINFATFKVQFASASIWRTGGGGGGGKAVTTVVLCGLTGEKQCGKKHRN